MFNFIHNNKKIIQGVLIIIFLPFLFFGIDSYFRTSDSGGHVATIGGEPISQQEFATALQERQNEIRRMVGDRIDPALLDTPELRSAVLDALVRRRLLLRQAARERIFIPDQELREIIGSQPAFQEDGKFAATLYNDLLRRRNMTVVGFESNLRRDLMLQRIGEAYSATAIVPPSLGERIARIYAEQREVSRFSLEPEKFVAEVKLADGAAQQYYESHAKEFETPEQVRLEYLVLALDDLAAQETTSPEEITQFYQAHAKQYGQAEEREASHILIATESKASNEEKQKARTKVLEILKQAKQNPASFGELAKKYSQDPGSAEKGGDLGYFSRGTMDPTFDAAVFQMKPGEIAGPVESTYGYHIIRVTGVRGGELASVRKEVERDLKRQKANKSFSELAEKLREQVFEQGDSLKPAAETLKVKLRQSGWVTRAGSSDPFFNNPKMNQAIFSDDVLKDNRNSDVVDVGNNTLISARVIERQPARVRPYAEVRAEIERRLTTQQAQQLALARGRELLNQLRKREGAPTVAWNAATLVQRGAAAGVGGAELAEIFKADVTQLPAYAGVENAKGGFSLFKISRVVHGKTDDTAQRKGLNDELRRLLGQEQFVAYAEALKRKTDVEINQGATKSP